MSDRKLLEMAAKAAGLGCHLYCEAWKAMAEYDPVEECFHGDSWNPLTNDGDALRLAVKLDMMVDPVNRVVAGYLGDICVDVDYDQQESDPCAATRRAIVRAAAEIGKAMLTTPPRCRKELNG